MIEKLTPEAVHQAFPAGGRVKLQAPGGSGPLTVAGVVADWTGQSLLVTLSGGASATASDGLVPGLKLEVVAQRLDGIYHLHGKVQKLHRKSETSASPHQQVAIGIAFDLARRVQERAFYRLSGSWPGVICIRRPECEEDVAGCLHRGQVWNLSGGGVLLEDYDKVLAPNMRFTLFLEIDDGGAPMRLDSRVVRQDQNSGVGSVLWGVRFVKIDREDEGRILRHLHSKIRERFHAEAGRTSASRPAAGS